MTATAPVVVQVGRSGTRLGDRRALAAARAAFAARHLVRLAGVIQPDLLEQLASHVERAVFTSRVHEDLAEPAIDHWVADPAVASRFAFTLNDPAFLVVIEQITGCSPIGSFHPVVYRLHDGDGHRDSWHSDVDGNRLAALTINLSRRPFGGGALAVRNRDTGQVLHEETPAAFGETLLLRIAEGLQHRVFPVAGPVARTVVTGWFLREPRFADLLHGAP